MAFPGGLVIKDLGTVTVAALVAAVAPGPSLVSGTPTCHRKGKRKRGGGGCGIPSHHPLSPLPRINLNFIPSSPGPRMPTGLPHLSSLSWNRWNTRSPLPSRPVSGFEWDGVPVVLLVCLSRQDLPHKQEGLSLYPGSVSPPLLPPPPPRPPRSLQNPPRVPPSQI